MPLPETSPLETALARITGETTAPPTKLIDYAAPLPIPEAQIVTAGAEQPVAPPAPEDPWLAEIRAQTAQIMAQNAAFAGPTSGITYADQLRKDLAASGVTGGNADKVVNASLAGGGYNASTIYNPNSIMNLNPDIPAGTMRTTTFGAYDPLKVTTKKVY
jgi:hypothetical protein